MTDNITLSKEDYLKAEIIALRKENKRLKRKLENDGHDERVQLCKTSKYGNCSNKSQMPSGFCYDCHDDYYI